VETVYGRQMGTWRVIDALSTLAFDFAPRAEFFRGELEQYLLFTRARPASTSSACAAPTPARSAFRSSCPAATAASRWISTATAPSTCAPARPIAIGSVANFLVKHGWQRGERVTCPARVIGGKRGRSPAALSRPAIEPKTPLSEMKRYGVETRTDLALDTPVALIELESPGALSEYRLGLRNFYVLTRYNRSVL
jgi:membrane-bound lytic murein transglycosylase B